MPRRIESSNVCFSNFEPSSAPAQPEGSPPPPTLPDPKTQLGRLINGDDVGAAIAAMVMMSSKERRQSAHAARDAAYAEQEAAQREELLHMREAASDRLKAGLLEGSFKLASAGASFAAVGPSAKANALDSKIKYAGGASDATIGEQSRLQKAGEYWSAGGKGFDAAATATPAIAKFFADREDEASKEAGMRADRCKRTAESQADDVKDADESLKKCLEFLRDWLNAKDAARSAAVHRA